MIRRTIAYMATVAGIVAFSAVFILIFGSSIDVRCIREADRDPDCRITQKFLGRVPLSIRNVFGVTAVQLDEYCDDGCTYRAVLVTSTGERVPVNKVYMDDGNVLRQMHALEAFLGGTAPTLEYIEPVQWWVLGLIMAMDLVVLAVVAWNFLRRARSGQS